MNYLQNKWERLGVAAMVMMAAASAHAGPIDDLLDGIDISGVAAKITSVAVVIVGIALVLKGPSIAKRLINKI